MDPSRTALQKLPTDLADNSITAPLGDMSEWLGHKDLRPSWSCGTSPLSGTRVDDPGTIL
jgi:hypothetical protein